MIRTGATPGRFDDLPEPESIIEACGGNENPLRFLAMSEPDTAVGLIDGIDDLERLRAWERAEREHVDPPRGVILDAIAEREAELTGEQPARLDDEEQSETDPKPASDPGPDPEPTPDPARSNVHANVSDVLEPGQVLAIDRGEKIEYVWPTRADADEPYVSLAIDAETETPWMELEVSTDVVENRRRTHDHDVIEASDVSVDPPSTAVSSPEVVA